MLAVTEKCPDVPCTCDLYMVMMWAYGNPHDDFWLKKTVNMRAFVSHMMKGKMYVQFKAALLKPDTWRTQYYISRDAAGELACPLPMPMSAWYCSVGGAGEALSSVDA